MSYHSSKSFDFNVVPYNSQYITTYSSESFNTELLQSANDSKDVSTVGAGGGALLGAMLGGVFGAAIGGFIGGLLGTLFGTDLNELKNEYYNQIVIKLRQLS